MLRFYSILASRCEYFKKQFSKDIPDGVLVLDNTKPQAFEQVLKFIYTNRCDFLMNGYEVKWEGMKENGKKSKSGAKSKTSNPLKIVIELSKKLNMAALTKRLSAVTLINGKISLQDTNQMPCLTFSRKSLPNLYDVNLLSSDGTVYGCHKCILAARLEYFHSMLGTCWSENSQLGNLTLPISSQIMEVLIDYLYTDAGAKVSDSDDIEFLCHMLMISDQLLILRLKEMCEISLVRLITLKNCAELLELSSVYNSTQLKRSCMQFICINLAAVIETKILEILSDDVMQDLTSYYRSLVPAMYKRKMSSNRNFLEIQELEFLEKQHPVSSTSHFEKNKIDSADNKTKRRRCSSLRSDSKESSQTPVKGAIPSQATVKDIVLDILKPNHVENVVTRSPQAKEVESVKSPLSPPDKRPGQWIMNLPSVEQLNTLDAIMLKELKLTNLQRKASVPDMKPIPHLSQKQKKMEALKNKTTEIAIPKSPPNQISCPWAKLPDQSPPSPSFWDAVAKKELQPSSLSRDLSAPVKNESLSPETKGSSKAFKDMTADIVISLHDIQIDEEQRLRRAVNPKIKPLHILNIEDQAIEELCKFYNVENNHKEKITVSRVTPDEIASPIWKRRGCH